jgi:hypothetical protein
MGSERVCISNIEPSHFSEYRVRTMERTTRNSLMSDHVKEHLGNVEEYVRSAIQAS